MDALLSGILGGFLGPPIGGILSRFRYPLVVVIGLLVGVLINVLLTLYDLFSTGGADAFSNSSSLAAATNYSDVLVALLFFPGLCVVGFVIIRALSPPPTMEIAQAVLESNGYEKFVRDDGRLVTYRKDRFMVVFRVDRRYGPPQAEWWRDGRRKGSILLRTPLHD